MATRGSTTGAERGRPHVDPPIPRTKELAPHDLGNARLEPGTPNGRPQKILRIDATAAPPNLIGRLLVGSYITGQDQVVVTARGGLTTVQRREIHRVVDRLLGMTVVADGPIAVEVQNFIDPGKYELARLLHRLVQLIAGEVTICRDALVSGNSSQLERIESVEAEIDQLYLLMARQLLLSSDSPRVARDIDVQSHHFQIGYRLVAKTLEVTGDLVHAIGTDLHAYFDGLRRMPPRLTHELVQRIERLEEVLLRSTAAFERLSVLEANAILNQISDALRQDAFLGQVIARGVPDRNVAAAAQRMVCNMVMALEMLVIVNETTINRSVEPETVARTEARVDLAVHAETRRSDEASRLVVPPPHRTVGATGRH